ncbi:hypothetical protein Acsp03_56810 [Actinomadura sp. NBRC 104412]|nr:hypothetical protein Acsp03_56810 [Actinomadura sp. NBRC 104412]
MEDMGVGGHGERRAGRPGAVAAARPIIGEGGAARAGGLPHVGIAPWILGPLPIGGIICAAVNEDIHSPYATGIGAGDA